MSDLRQMFQAEQHTLQRGIVGRVVSLADAKPPQMDVKGVLGIILVLGLGSSFVLSMTGVSIAYAWQAAAVVAAISGSLPLLVWLLNGLIVRGTFGDELQGCSTWIKLFYGMVVGVLLHSFLVRWIVPAGKEGEAMAFMALGFPFLFIPLSGLLVGRRLWGGLVGAAAAAKAMSAPAPAAPVQAAGPAPFALRLGYSSGHFATLGHGASMAPGQPVVLGLKDAATNTIIFGGIGSGKTTRMINPLLLQVLSQDAGALIFDIKTDFIKETDYLAREAGRPYRIIGDGGMPFNLLQGLPPEVVASFLKSAFLMAEGGKSAGNAFWLDGAVEYCRNALGLLQYFPEKYTLIGLFRFVFDDEEKTTVFEAIEDLRAANAVTADQYRMLQANTFYFTKIWDTKEDKEKSYIMSTCAQVLSPFSNPALVDGFCTVSEDGEQARLEDLVNRGAVFLVEIPMTKYGKEGARVAYLFIKLRFMQVMKERNSRPEWNQSRPVAFICDEYQAIIDPVSDNDFWDKSRSAKTIGIVSMQGYSSMIDAVGERAAATIMQNFRERICFRTEDENTLVKLQKLLGQVDVAKVSESKGSSNSESAHGGSTGDSYTRSVSYQRQDVINPQLFRQLGQDQAVAILNVNGVAFDDVINCGPLFIPEDYQPQTSKEAA